MSNWIKCAPPPPVAPAPDPCPSAAALPPFTPIAARPSWRPIPLPEKPTAVTRSPTGQSVSEWARESLGFDPFPIQVQILDCPDPFVLLCCTRQLGKTTLTAIKAAYHLLTVPNACVVVGAPGKRQSARLVRRAVSFLRRAGITVRAAGDGTYGVTLSNGSAIYALPRTPVTTRGFGGVTLLIIDEAAFVADEFYEMATAFQAVVANPQLWLLSTPAGQLGFFYEEWSDTNRAHWRRIRIRASECPHISEAFLARERLSKGAAVYRREYECEFDAGATRLIPPELWDRAERKDSTRLFNDGRPLWSD